MNIQQILSEGVGLQLSNVTVKADYGQKQGQTPHRALLVEDTSGKTILKLWGATSGTPYAEGTVLTVQGVGQNGNLSASEFKGKWSINANSCEVIVGGGAGQPQAGAGQPAAGGQAPAHQSAPPQAHNQSSGQMAALTPEELADAQAAHFARLIQRITPPAEEIGADPSAITMAAATMTGSASDYWFGAKWPGMPGLKAKVD